MLQPPNSGSYLDFRAQMRRKMQQNGQVKEKLLAAFTAVYDQTLQDSRVVLARFEKEHLFKQLLEDTLTELINENKESHG